uniref:outer membrane beta-barrel protein n=1 Tax=uncultured Rhizobium sp. TaxID=155567 RepID=UPI00262B2342|nr:outer membrane beta-barrel protein [uncultured Rhizobium sp.]
MGIDKNTGLRGAGRLGLHAAAGLLATHVFALPVPAFAQQATATKPSSAAVSTTQQAAATQPAGADDLYATGDDTQNADGTTTGTIPDEGTLPGTPLAAPLNDPMVEADGGIAQDPDFARQNLRETRLDDPTAARIRREDDKTPGIRLGTMVLRPSISQAIGSETSDDGAGRETRIFSETGLKGTLTSDWSRHQLTIGGEGYWQNTISGDTEDKPRANINADLRLDLADDTIANITGGYNYSREDTDDPNAVAGASAQSAVNQFDAGLSIERDLGLLRGSIAGDITRWQYSDVKLSDGSTLSRSDRDRMRSTVSARVGYELSPALTPFVEGTIGRISYDDTVDANGYERSADVYAAKVGVAVDLGEKLRGELGVGHERQRYDDSRLAELSALTVDGNLYWSPQEGTDIDLVVETYVDPSTTAGVNGVRVHRLTAKLEHDLRSNLVARLSSGLTLTNYDGVGETGNSTGYLAGAGLTWSINRYLDATADLNYERTDYKYGGESSDLTALVGLTAKR